MGDFRGICNGADIHHSKSAPSLLVGFSVAAGQWSSSRWSRALPQAPTQGSMSFPWQVRGHHEHVWHFKSLPWPTQCLRAVWELTLRQNKAVLSRPLPKIIFQTRYYHGCAETRSHCTPAAVADVCCDTQYPHRRGLPEWLHEPAPVPLQGSAGMPSDPAVLFPAASSAPAFCNTHVTAPLLTRNYESYWMVGCPAGMNPESGSFYHY